MSNFLSSGAGWLAMQLNKHASDEVEYSRGSITATIRATKGRSTFESDLGDGHVMQTEPVDWIVGDESLCKFRKLFDTPEPGDRISFNNANFEVLPTVGEKVSREPDQYGALLRIHTKEVW